MGWTDLYSPLVPSRGRGTRRRPDLRGPAAALAKVAAAVVDEAEVAEFVEMAVTVLVEVAAVMDQAEEAPGAEARRRLDLSGVAAVLAEVAVTDERRHSWRRRRRPWRRGGARGRAEVVVAGKRRRSWRRRRSRTRQRRRRSRRRRRRRKTCGGGGGCGRGGDARGRPAELAKVVDGAVTPSLVPGGTSLSASFWRIGWSRI
ncbi:hypothetical protein DAI22_06g018000 [Oryza sativa Japonica Group]|nr:hypothetical protein DAI22_06g018000 [Oryza sativa Japonica Group]